MRRKNLGKLKRKIYEWRKLRDEYGFTKTYCLHPVYGDPQWQTLRERVFKRFGRVCLKCKTTLNIVVDHVIPIQKDSSKAFQFNNLQPLCASCNKEKLNSTIDFRINYLNKNKFILRKQR